jgi:tight adherence protein B
MLAPVLVFLVVVALTVGAYALSVYVPKALARHRLEQRLHEIGASAGPSDSHLVKERKEGPVPALDRVVAATPAGAYLARLIDQAAVSATPGGVILSTVALGAGAAFGTSLFVRHAIGVVTAGLIGAAVPLIWLQRTRSVRMKRFEEQFPEALDLLSRAIRAGHGFQTSLGMVASELPTPVGPEFKKTFDQQNFGLPLKEALNQLSERVPLLDVRFFVTAVTIQRETGGNLAEILDNLAHVVRERFKIRRQVRVHTAHGRFTGYVLMALPAVLAVMLSRINPDMMNLLFTERMGQMMLAGAVILQTIGYVWIRQVIKIEV